MAADWVRNIKVILDTNALLMPFQFHINLDAELTKLLGDYEIIIPSSVRDELQVLVDANIKVSHIEAAIKLSRKYRTVVVDGQGDESIFSLACKLKAYVVTNDKRLRKRLKAEGLNTISLKSKTHLVLD